jgi:hypothetical protein
MVCVVLGWETHFGSGLGLELGVCGKPHAQLLLRHETCRRHSVMRVGWVDHNDATETCQSRTHRQ